MSDNGKITPKITSTTTVRDVLMRYPQAQRVFNKYGLTGCGGPKGPIEPLHFFATVHNVDGDQLLKELNEVADSVSQDTDATGAEAATPPEVYRAFIKTAIIISLTTGCTLGAITLAAMALGGSVGTYWASITQAHGHTQIFGWVGLFVMGIAYHVLPRLKATELKGRSLAQASFWIMLVGLLLRAVSQPFAVNATVGNLLMLSGVLELAGVSLFAYVMLKTFFSSDQPRDFFEKWVLASVGWFWITAVATLAIDIFLARNALDVVPNAIEVPFLHISLFGFVGTIIFGITLRTIPLFMGLKPVNKKAFDVIFWIINPVIAAKALALLLNGYGVGAAGAALPWLAVLEWTAVMAFVYYLNIFRRPEIDISAEGADRGYEKYIKIAYAWLTLAVTMTSAYLVYEAITGQEVPHAFVGAYRHALTVGFISMMIMGMASRIIPVFAGVRLYSERILFVSFVLINLGNATRVLSQPLADVFGGVFFASMGVSGFIEVTALALFGYNIWKTMDRIEEEEVQVAQPTEITKDDVVGEVLDRYPQTLGVFLEYGFTQLKNPEARQTLAQSITIEQASRILPVDLESFLGDLNRIRSAVDQSVANRTTVSLPITRDQLVGEVIEAFPSTLQVFVSHGFEHLKNPVMRNTVAKTVTVEIACRVHELDLNRFLAELNTAAGAAEVSDERITA